MAGRSEATRISPAAFTTPISSTTRSRHISTSRAPTPISNPSPTRAAFRLPPTFSAAASFLAPFPYSKGYDSAGNYGIPGISNYVTHGNNDEFGISWSLNLPRKPSLSAGYQLGNNDYSVYGSDNQGKSSFHSFNLRSSYEIAGLDMTRLLLGWREPLRSFLKLSVEG